MLDPFMLHLSQLFALRPTLQSLGITQAQIDLQYELVLEHYAEQLVRFFSGPRNLWDRIAQRLAQRLHIARLTLDDAASRAMLGLVLSYPDSGERDKRFAGRSPQVYLVTRHDCLALAISREGDTPLVFTLSRGIETLDVSALTGAERLAHDVFEGWALASLDQALLRIARVDPSRLPGLDALDRQLMWASRLSGFVETGHQHDSLRHELEQQLPDWLRNASAAGRLAYSQWLEALAAQHEKTKGAIVYRPEHDVDTQAGAAAQSVFARDLALHLRRLTLECCLQGQANVTYEGYRVVRAAVKVHKAQRRLRGVAMVFRPLMQGGGYLVGPQTDTQGPWLLVRPGTDRVIEQVSVAPDAGSQLDDPFMAFYRTGIARWSVLFERPLDILARLKQVGGNFDGACEVAHARRCEASLLLNLALLLVYPASAQPVEAPQVHPQAKRLDSDWAGASKDLSLVQDQQLERLRRPRSATVGRLITDGFHKGLHVLSDVLIYNKDENHYNVLANNQICLNCNIVQHQLVDNPAQPTVYGPHIASDTHGYWQLQRAPRVRRDLVRLNLAVREGNALSATAPALQSEAGRRAQIAGALPVEVEEWLELKARRFDVAVRNIQDAGGNAPQVNELNQLAGHLRAHGRYLRLDMTRRTLKPTIGDVQYLLGQQAIRIRRLDGRVAETIDGQVDYLQEYEIQDLTDANKPLWYAHFHYPTLQTPEDQPTRAHLKTAAQRRLGRVFEQNERAAGRNTQVYRGPITNAIGRQLFLGVTSPT